MKINLNQKPDRSLRPVRFTIYQASVGQLFNQVMLNCQADKQYTFPLHRQHKDSAVVD